MIGRFHFWLPISVRFCFSGICSRIQCKRMIFHSWTISIRYLSKKTWHSIEISIILSYLHRILNFMWHYDYASANQTLFSLYFSTQTNFFHFNEAKSSDRGMLIIYVCMFHSWADVIVKRNIWYIDILLTIDI